MRNIVLNLAVTLDGFIEGPNGEIDWCILDEDAGTFFDTFLDSLDTIFYGRKSYDLWGEYQPEAGAAAPEIALWKGVHSKKKYVFSSHPLPADSQASLISTDIVARVEEIKAQSGKDIWLYGGANLVRSFMELNLIDRYILAVHPILLGDGKPLFVETAQRTPLKLISAIPSASGVVTMDYQVVRQN